VRLAIAIGIHLAVVFAAPPARGQISPGPLSRAHESLEGNTHCFECHGSGDDAMKGQCLACHAGIASLIASSRGLHAKDAGGECASCHPEHAGRDFDLIEWPEGGLRAFDHARTGWPLAGRHAEVRCQECHKPELQVGEALRLEKRKTGEGSWLGLETACAACHKDPHGARFGTDCASCHSAADWRAVDTTSFDHERTRYPLRGAHARVACDRCHAPGGVRVARPAFDRCAACHADAHAGQTARAGVAPDCESCHRVDAFAPSTFTRERHAGTAYPLDGRHAHVACASCHPKEGGAAAAARLGAAAITLRRAFASCRDCHADAHAGQLAHRDDKGNCESCHSAAGWTPSSFDSATHRATEFPLEGRHAATPCARCHGPERDGLPAVAAETAGPARRLFTFDTVACEACHADPHAGRYAAGGAAPRDEGCVACHGVDSFRPSLIDVAAHARLGTPLEGAHRAVPCFLCHADLDRPAGASTLRLAKPALPPLPFTSRRERCADCHETPHGDQFDARPAGDDCALCHTSDAFRPASRFDHDRDASFALRGAHASVPCADCHKRRDSAAGAVVIYRPLSAECSTCHGEARGGAR